MSKKKQENGADESTEHFKNFLTLFCSDEEAERFAAENPPQKPAKPPTDEQNAAAVNQMVFLLMMQSVRESIHSETGLDPDEQGNAEDILIRLDHPEKFHMYQQLHELAANPQNEENADLFENLFVAFFKSVAPNLDEETIRNEREELLKKLPIMHASIPERHLIPNNKLMTALQKGDLFNQAVDLIVLNPGQKNEITTAVKVTYRKDGAYLPTNYTEFDRSVMDAVLSQYEYGSGNGIFTPQLIYRTMTYKKDSESPSPKQIDAIVNSIEKMRFMELDIDATDEMREWMKGRHLAFDENKVQTKWKGYLLPANAVEVELQGKNVKAYQMIQEPPIYSYAKARKQILTCDARLLNIHPVDENGKISDYALPLTEKRIEISSYLLRRVLIMQYDKKNHINKQSCMILLESVFGDVGLSELSRNSSMDYRNFITQVLAYYKAVGFIAGYEEKRQGRKIVGFEILLK